jgi:hypothetical protein
VDLAEPVSFGVFIFDDKVQFRDYPQLHVDFDGVAQLLIFSFDQEAIEFAGRNAAFSEDFSDLCQ